MLIHSNSKPFWNISRHALHQTNVTLFWWDQIPSLHLRNSPIKKQSKKGYKAIIEAIVHINNSLSTIFFFIRKPISQFISFLGKTHRSHILQLVSDNQPRLAEYQQMGTVQSSHITNIMIKITSKTTYETETCRNDNKGKVKKGYKAS